MFGARKLIITMVTLLAVTGLQADDFERFQAPLKDPNIHKMALGCSATAVVGGAACAAYSIACLHPGTALVSTLVMVLGAREFAITEYLAPKPLFITNERFPGLVAKRIELMKKWNYSLEPVNRRADERDAIEGLRYHVDNKVDEWADRDELRITKANDFIERTFQREEEPNTLVDGFTN